jgi:hypothetical protein
VDTELNKKEPLYEAFAPLKKVLNIATGKIEMKLDTANLGSLFASSLDVSGDINVVGSVITNRYLVIKGGGGLFANSIGAAETPELTLNGPCKFTGDCTFLAKTNVNPFHVAGGVTSTGVILFSKANTFRAVFSATGTCDLSWDVPHPDGSLYIVHLTIDASPGAAFQYGYDLETSTSIRFFFRNASNAIVNANFRFSIFK